jgi:hypothetical protein
MVCVDSNIVKSYSNYTAVIRSQVKAIYRYGGRPVCGHKLEDFKFCMSIKSMHPEERRDTWIRRRAEWWAHRRMAKSSEDIWDIRSSVEPDCTPNNINT